VVGAPAAGVEPGGAAGAAAARVDPAGGAAGRGRNKAAAEKELVLHWGNLFTARWKVDTARPAIQYHTWDIGAIGSARKENEKRP